MSNWEKNLRKITPYVPGEQPKNSNIIKGDILEKIDGIKVETMNDLKKYVYEKNIGDEVTLTIKRNKKKFEVKIKLEKL